MRPRDVRPMRCARLRWSLCAKYAEGSCLANSAIPMCCHRLGRGARPAISAEYRQGWVTGNTGMLPRSTRPHRSQAARGRQSGRTQEIQRLIGGSLRAVTDLTRLGERQTA